MLNKIIKIFQAITPYLHKNHYKSETNTHFLKFINLFLKNYRIF